MYKVYKFNNLRKEKIEELLQDFFDKHNKELKMHGFLMKI